MKLNLHVERVSSRVPLYRQIAAEIIARIEDGSLPHGSRLPTVRELADDLGVNPVTVHNAYRDARSQGWIQATVGKGTYVSGRAAELPEPTSSTMTPTSVMADMNRFGAAEGFLSLAMAEGDPDLYPAAEFFRVLQSLRKDAPSLLRYGSPQGDSVLRQELTGLLQERGVSARPDEVLVTTGVTQGMSLVVDALCDGGDTVVVERPTYLGLLGLLESSGVRPIGVPMDEEGPRLDVLRTIVVRDRPRFFYTIPTFQNPTGISMSPERRSGLLSLAREYSLTLIEDDTYCRLDYDATSPPSLKAMDRDDLVIYLDGFSKVLLPGLRIGYAVVPASIKERMLSLLQVRSFCQPSLLHRGLAEFLRRERFHAHLKRILPVYKSRRDALLFGLRKSMPEEVTWITPHGGFCCWVTLPENGDFGDLYRAALSRGVAFTPGSVFQATPEPRGHIRLCFGASTETDIQRATRILGEVVKERLSAPVPLSTTFTDRPPIV